MTRFLGLRGRRLASAISGVCGLCFLCFGYAQGVMGGLLTVPAFLERFPQVDTLSNSSARNAMVQGAVVGAWNVGCFVSAILTIFIGDYLGRKKTLMLGLTFWVIGEVVQCSSFGLWQFTAGRFIAGFGNGFTTSTVPAYQAECVKSHRKGTILMISAGAFIALGLALSYWLVFAFAYITSYPSVAWRTPIAFQIIFALIAFSILIFLPESPRWLILTGKEHEALEVLAALNDEDFEGPEIRDEFLQIKDAILVMSQGSTSSLTSNKDRRSAHRVILAYGVQLFQQISGINLSLQYLALMLYSQFGFTGWFSRLLGACAATEYFIASFVAVVGIDRFWGRRSLMMFGSSGMCMCMALLAVLGYLFNVKGVSGTHIAASVLLFGFSTFFAIGWQGMAWLYQVEIVPLRIRGPANALSTSGNWLFNWLVVFTAPIAFHSIGYKTYIIFACTNFAIIPLIYFFYPETAYRSLEEVDSLFHIASQEPGNPWLNVVRISKEQPLWFGKKGDVPFNYKKSEWHKHCLATYGSGTTLENKDKRGSTASNSNTADTESGIASGSGSGKGKNGKRTGIAGEGSSVGGRIFAIPTDISAYNDTSASPTCSNFSDHDRSRDSFKSTGTAGSVMALYRPPRLRELGNRMFSFYSTISMYSNRSGYSAQSDPNWAVSELAPMPLKVPTRASSAHTRGTCRTNKGSGGSGYYPGKIGSVDIGRPGPGIYRTPSGRETYYPDEIEEAERGMIRRSRSESAASRTGRVC